MSFQYIKKNKHKNEGVFVPLKGDKDWSGNLENEEILNESMEDWQKIVATEEMEGDQTKVSNKDLKEIEESIDDDKN